MSNKTVQKVGSNALESNKNDIRWRRIKRNKMNEYK